MYCCSCEGAVGLVHATKIVNFNVGGGPSARQYTKRERARRIGASELQGAISPGASANLNCKTQCAQGASVRLNYKAQCAQGIGALELQDARTSLARPHAIGVPTTAPRPRGPRT
ncbi:hypothetical protein PAECIP111893_05180 [Paenibacillus plantiphilus]|uniref:Uncharacterized protein n=1 Tax=Paenibacillus plantiphilus TaxID=2905650 RepID=A0ABM9CWP3_9BACL|nr:hypothetical protein PAECIP111893_05180 [Paenibacillus plantiphilus]